MTWIRNLAAIAALMAVTCLCAVLAIRGWQLGGDARRTMAEMRMVAWQVSEMATELPTRLDHRLASESSAWRRTADSRLGSLERSVNARLAGFQEVSEYQLAAANQSIAGLRSDIGPVLEQARATIAAGQPVLESSDRAVRLWTPQVLGLVAAGKVTAGETATTMREFRRATPDLLAGVDRIVQNSDRTSAATARVMDNFARATKPLPTWARITFAVAPSVAQIAGGVATTLAVTGKVGP